MKPRLILSFLLVMAVAAATSAQAYRIAVEIGGYEEDELYLAYYLGDKQYIQDTVQRRDDGTFVFSGEEALPGGIYLVVMAPDNQFFQILVDDKNQQFSVTTTEQQEGRLPETTFKGSADNSLFYDYLSYLGEKRPAAEQLQQEIQAETDEGRKARLQSRLDKINEEVQAYQRRLVEEHPGTMTAMLIKANFPMDYPEFEGEEEDQQRRRWRWTQRHYFDHLDLADPRILRTPFLFQRVDYFVQKLTVQHPDTIGQAIDRVLTAMQPAPETFKFYLIHFLNFYAASKFVGMDAVYVHIVDNYYAKGLASWTEEEQLNKIIDNANRLRPLLIGRTAPDLRMMRRDSSYVNLHDVDAEYTVLYFWRYDCGHCKESTPHMKEFYENFHDKGVEVFAVCAKLRDEVPACWEYIDENEIGDWLHVVDPFGRSRFTSLYDLQTTPQVYILNREKEIISKRIGAEQLGEVMEQIIEQDAQRRRQEMLENEK